MAVSKLYSFPFLFKEGIQKDNGAILKVKRIVIPKIQRAYAQGRESEKNVREVFLNDIFEHLCSGQSMELNFIYGTMNRGDFELLDGQQRLTTLYLLYWYVSNVESDDRLDFLQNFVYDTRTTSTDFLTHLSNRKYAINDKPSTIITKSKFYTHAYSYDSTVESMLNMLDSIHERYVKLDGIKVLHNLDKIQFYVELLDDYAYPEELYIKMNARGLKLTPFENFKADMVKYLKSNGYDRLVDYAGKLGVRQMPYYMRFSTKMDNMWTDMFWKDIKTDEECCAAFFRFFYRFMANKYITIVMPDQNADSFRFDDVYSFFDEKSEKQIARYEGFNKYSSILTTHPSFIEEMELVLDTFSEYYTSVIAPLLTPVWEETSWNYYSPHHVYDRRCAIKFAAVTEYIIACKNIHAFQPDNFARWMRIVNNVVENTNIDGIRPQVGLTRRLVGILSSHTAIRDIYRCMSGLTLEKNVNRALAEEVIKAKMIVDHPSEAWESAFLEAEHHPFLKGMIGFYLNEGDSLDLFKNRYERICEMFDADGITAPFREKHILLRSLLCQLTDQYGDNGFNDQPITEKVERDKHIKNTLASRHSIRELFKNVTLAHSREEVLDMLAEEIDRERDLSHLTLEAKLAYFRIKDDVRLYDWIMSEECSKGKMMKIQSLYGNIFVNIPRSWWSKVIIDTERHLMIPKLIELYGFSLVDENLQAMYNCVGDYYGYGIDLVKKIGKCTIFVRFDTSHNLFVKISGISNDKARELHGRYPDLSQTEKSENDYRHFGFTHYTTYSDSFRNIVDLVEKATELAENIEDEMHDNMDI